MKKSHISLGVAALGILPALPAIAAPAPKQPNILIITTDQQTWNMMSIEGATPLATPAMDRLANNGYRFRRAYCANPVCMPSRFALYTGHYSSEIGTKDNTPHPADTKNNLRIATEHGMGNLFRKAGYETHYSGKTHLYKPLNEDRKPPEIYGFKLQGFDPYEGPVDFAKKFFANRKAGDKPFLVVLSFMNPHDICEQAGIGRNPATLRHGESNRLLAIQKKLPPAQFAAQTPPMVANTAPINGEQPAWVEMDSKSRAWTNSDWSLYRWLYYRLTESVDNQIGRALAALYASPLNDNTIIVFTSDHGDMQGAHGLSLKNVPFEECQRIPFILSGPGIRKGVADDTLVCNGLDLLPTLCDLAGVKYPGALPGKSLKPLLTGSGPAPERDHIVTETYNSYTIHDGRHKYTVFELPGNPGMLVDLQTDPGELRNLAGEKSSEKIQAKLKEKLAKHLAARNLLPLRTDLTLAHIRKVQAASKKGETAPAEAPTRKKNNRKARPAADEE
jgi:choline-sulfatase